MSAKKLTPTQYDGTGAKPRRRWSRRVTETSDALDLEPGVFKLADPHEIALSLKRSAERSSRRKASPFQAAMSMLSFYINRAGRRLSDLERERLEAAKDELRELYGRARRNNRSSGKVSAQSP